MADAVLERRPASRFFCHRCNIEFEDILQLQFSTDADPQILSCYLASCEDEESRFDSKIVRKCFKNDICEGCVEDYICPYCASGFIELIESDRDSSATSDDVSEADMSTIDDSDEMHQIATHPMLNDLAFLMSGGRLRGSERPSGRLLEQLIWTISGGEGNAAITAGSPFVLVGAPGDYVFGGEGLDAAVTQLLGQLENSGPPPLPRDQIENIASITVTAEQVAANTACSVCWENFTLGETVSRLECEHIFHPLCITPWLQLHATCPICRHSLLTNEPAAESDQDNRAVTPSPPSSDTSSSRSVSSAPSVPSLPSAALLLGRMARLVPGLQAWESPAGAAPGSSAAWAPRQPPPRRPPPRAPARQPPGSDSDYNMDIDFD